MNERQEIYIGVVSIGYVERRHSGWFEFCYRSGLSMPRFKGAGAAEHWVREAFYTYTEEP